MVLSCPLGRPLPLVRFEGEGVGEGENDEFREWNPGIAG